MHRLREIVVYALAHGEHATCKPEQWVDGKSRPHGEALLRCPSLKPHGFIWLLCCQFPFHFSPYCIVTATMMYMQCRVLLLSLLLLLLCCCGFRMTVAAYRCDCGTASGEQQRSRQPLNHAEPMKGNSMEGRWEQLGSMAICCDGWVVAAAELTKGRGAANRTSKRWTAKGRG